MRYQPTIIRLSQLRAETYNEYRKGLVPLRSDAEIITSPDNFSIFDEEITIITAPGDGDFFNIDDTLDLEGD